MSEQPLGYGFASDYGLQDLLGSDPNFAFGANGATAVQIQAAQQANGTPLAQGYANTPDGTLIYTDPNGIQYTVINGVYRQLNGYNDGATYNGLPQGQSSLGPGDPGYVAPGTPQNQVPGYYQADASGAYMSGDYQAYLNYAQSRGVSPSLGPGASIPAGPNPTLAAHVAQSQQQAAATNAQNAASHPQTNPMTHGGGFLPTYGLGVNPTTTGGGSGGSGGGGGTGGGSAGGGGAPAVGTGTAAQNGAMAYLQQALNTYGLGSMANWAWQEIVAGKSQDQVLLDLMQTQQFKDRFPAIAARQQAGLPAISPGDYINYENQATQIMRDAGLPAGFWDSPADFTHLIANDVSINELTQRVNLASQAAYQVPADVRATLERDYGVGAGQLAAFFLDDKTALPLIQRDFTAAQIGGAAYRTGYGTNKAQDEMLTDLGVSAGQAQQGFTQLVQQRQLYSSLPGENTTGISRDDQLAAMFGGNAQAQEQILRRAQQRQAVFNQGGDFAQNPSGYQVGVASNA